MLSRIARTNAPASIILIRLAVGFVFFTEGIQKFLFAADRGAGRFEKIGIPYPEIMGPLVGGLETIGGALLLIGLFTRLAALPLIGIMCIAIVTTKIPILLGEEFLGFSLPKLSSYGFWSMAHESRTDLSMLAGSIYLLIVGAGPWSADARIARKGAGSPRRRMVNDAT